MLPDWDTMAVPPAWGVTVAPIQNRRMCGLAMPMVLGPRMMMPCLRARATNRDSRSLPRVAGFAETGGDHDHMADLFFMAGVNYIERAGRRNRHHGQIHLCGDILEAFIGRSAQKGSALGVD